MSRRKIKKKIVYRISKEWCEWKKKVQKAEESSQNAGDNSKADLSCWLSTREDAKSSQLSAMDAAGGSPEQSFSSSGDSEKTKVYVAVGTGSNSTAMVLWALHNFSEHVALVLLHVYPQPKLIPISTCSFLSLLSSGSQMVVFIALAPSITITISIIKNKCSIMPAKLQTEKENKMLVDMILH